MTQDLDARLDRIFKADREMRLAQQEFFGTGDDSARVDAIQRAIDGALKLTDPEDASERLMRLADLLADLGGAKACALLAQLLDHDEPGVRASAGEGLLELGQSRYAEVARCFEKLVDEGKATTALSEIPYILAELGEPGGIKLCVKLLKHSEGDIVGAAIEALASLGDPVAIKDIERLKNDRRRITVEEELETGELTVGELATEAVEHLRSLRD